MERIGLKSKKRKAQACEINKLLFPTDKLAIWSIQENVIWKWVIINTCTSPSKKKLLVNRPNW